MSAVPLVVQKFGGRCLDTTDAAAHSVERVLQARAAGLQPVVVVSALGRKGQPYSTAALVQLLTDISPDIEPRALDLMMACGEIIAAVRMAHLLAARGVPAVALTGGQAGILTTRRFGKARVTLLKADRIAECLSAGEVPCVTGFQGVSEVDHEVTTLGEGGSDYTAVALALWLRQRSPLPALGEVSIAGVEFYKETPGIRTADPRSVPDGVTTDLIPELTHAELEEVARYCSRVFQFEAAQAAREGDLPLVFRAVDPAVAEETRIVPRREAALGEAAAVLDLSNLACFTLTPRSGIAARERELRGWVHAWLWEERGVLPLFLPGDEGVAFAVRREQYRDTTALVAEAFEGTGIACRAWDEAVALVTLVGEGLRGRPRALVDAVRKALASTGTPVPALESSDLSVRVLVPEGERVRTVGLLHEAFVRGKQPMKEKAYDRR